MLRFSVAVLSKGKDMMLQSRQSAIQEAKANKTQTNWLMNAFPNHLPLWEAWPKTDNTSQLVLAEGYTENPKYATKDPIKRNSKVV